MTMGDVRETVQCKFGIRFPYNVTLRTQVLMVVRKYLFSTEICITKLKQQSDSQGEIFLMQSSQRLSLKNLSRGSNMIGST